MVHPNLVLCIGQDGKVRVESSSSPILGLSDSGFDRSCIADSLDHPSGACVDVPISMPAIRTEFSPTYSPGMTIVTPFVALDSLLPQTGVIKSYSSLSRAAPCDDLHLSIIRTTILLV
jgi:hypothetical protein